MQRYRFYYRALPGILPDSFRTEQAVDANDPVAAIGVFHSVMQTTQNISFDRGSVLRRKLLPDEYFLIRAVHEYRDADNKAIQSELDLPASKNPDLTLKIEVKPLETMEMKLE